MDQVKFKNSQTIFLSVVFCRCFSIIFFEFYFDDNGIFYYWTMPNIAHALKKFPHPSQWIIFHVEKFLSLYICSFRWEHQLNYTEKVAVAWTRISQQWWRSLWREGWGARAQYKHQWRRSTQAWTEARRRVGATWTLCIRKKTGSLGFQNRFLSSSFP